MSRIAGKVCVVTGAGSGIGRALAIGLAERGASGVAISDIHADTLEETAKMVDRPGTTVHQEVLDVGDREAFGAYAGRVAGRFGVIHQIYNNAGIADSDPVDQFGYDRYERVLRVNLWGVIHGTKEFLPHLIASGDGHIVNISSLNGVMAQKGLSAYCASKFAVRGFTESVGLDLKGEGHPVKTTVVHPGGVKTAIANSSLEWSTRTGLPVSAEHRARTRFYNEKLLRMDPSRAARIIMEGVESDRPRILVGNDARAVDALVRFFPRRWPSITGLLDRRIEKAIAEEATSSDRLSR